VPASTCRIWAGQTAATANIIIPRCNANDTRGLRPTFLEAFRWIATYVDEDAMFVNLTSTDTQRSSLARSQARPNLTTYGAGGGARSDEGVACRQPFGHPPEPRHASWPTCRNNQAARPRPLLAVIFL